MTSYKKQIETGFLSNAIIYSLLALYMPMTILTAFVFLIETIMSVSLNSRLLIINGIICGIITSIYCDFFNDNNSSKSADIRGSVIIVIMFYIFTSSLRREVSFIEKFFPNLDSIFSSITALYVWVSVISLKRIFSARMLFEKYTAIYRDEKLQEVLFEDSRMMKFTEENINRAKINYIFQIILVGFTTLSCAIFNISFPFFLYILLFIIFIGSISISGFFNIIRQEQYYAGEGIALTAHDRIKRILSMIVLSVICFFSALPLASNKSLLPFSIVTRFIDWFFKLFRQPERSRSTVTASTRSPTGFTETVRSPPREERTPFPFRDFVDENLGIILRYGFIILLASIFILFMISPLLSKDKNFKRLDFIKKLFRIIAEWFKDALAALVLFFINLKNNRKMYKLRKYSAEEIRRTAENLLGAYSAAKKSDMKRSVTLFARLIIWGDEIRKVIWKPALAPAEYCAVLANAIPEYKLDSVILKRNEGIIRCGELFEKALYSADVLTHEEQKEFKDLIEEITSADETASPEENS